VAINEERLSLDSYIQSLKQKHKQLEEDKRQREQANNSNISKVLEIIIILTSY
jgi:hypothetical protein